MHYQEAKKHQKAFNKAYDSWKQSAKESRSKIKTLCSHEDLYQIQRTIQGSQDVVNQCYASLLRNHTANQKLLKELMLVPH